MAFDAIAALLLASLPLGFAHALDPDHIMTMSVLSARDAKRRDGVSYAVRWALGHGGMLLLIASMTLLFHWALPPNLPDLAERVIGVILIAAGLAMIWALLRQHRLAGCHEHSRAPAAHTQTPTQTHASAHAGPTIRRAPFAIGMVHGIAGSAAMLALIPMTFYRPTLGLVYVVVFSLGVLVGMMSFGLALGRVQHWLARTLPHLQQAMRGLLGMGAIGMGLFWLQAG